ncbi:hypothetical protein ACPF8X_15885 [Streptomyces sp. G35A]
MDAFHQVADPDQQLTRFEELRSELREACDPPHAQRPCRRPGRAVRHR